MIASAVGNTYLLYDFRYLHGPGVRNELELDDPQIKAACDKMQEALVYPGEDEANRLYREMLKYVLDQAWTIPRVTPYQYSLWWPWLKNYSGESEVGTRHRHAFPWIWIDQELKKSMGY